MNKDEMNRAASLCFSGILMRGEVGSGFTGFTQKKAKKEKSNISSELVKLREQQKFVKCSSGDALFDENNLVNT